MVHARTSPIIPKLCLIVKVFFPILGSHVRFSCHVYQSFLGVHNMDVIELMFYEMSPNLGFLVVPHDWIKVMHFWGRILNE